MQYQKYKFTHLNTDYESRSMDVGQYKLPTKNVRTMSAIKKGSLESVKGTQDLDVNLPAGTNTIIGTHEDFDAGELVFFNHNSNSNHGVYSIDKSGTQSTIIELSDLNFNTDFPITGTAQSGRLLFFTDNLNEPKGVDLDNSYSGTSDIVSLIKPAPPNRPLIRRLNTQDPVEDWKDEVDNTYKRNIITDKNYQFSMFFVYSDDSESVLSPYSTLVRGDYIPDPENDYNAIGVTITVSSEARYNQVKQIKVCYRQGNDGDWIAFETLDDPDMSSDIKVVFYGYETGETIPDVNASKLFDSIGGKVEAMATAENRLFLANEEEGFDIDNTISISTEEDTALTNYTYFNQVRKLKERGRYELGLVWYDGKMRNSGVTNSISVTTTEQDPSLDTHGYSSISQDKNIKLTINGDPPSDASYMKVAMTKEQNFALYQQFPVGVYFYIAELGDEGAVTADEFKMDGKAYKKAIPTARNQYQYIHLKFPTNIPFVPNTDCYIRILSDTGKSITTFEPVLSVDADKIVVDDFDIDDWTDTATYWLVECYIPSQQVTQIYYELPGEHEVTGKFTDYVIDVYGDTYLSREGASEEKSWFQFAPIAKEDGSPTYSLEDKDGTRSLDFTGVSARVESPTPMYNSTLGTTAASTTKLRKEVVGTTFNQDAANTFTSRAVSIGAGIGTAITPGIGTLIGAGVGVAVGAVASFFSFREDVEEPVERTVDLTAGYTLDYTKIDADYGRPVIEINNESKQRLSNVVRYSDPKVIGSNVNGLSSFNALNQYGLPEERTPIRKLVLAGDVLLAIHERNTTALYLRQSFIKQGDEYTLTKSANIIGDDRLLEGYGTFGTIHPESVKEFRNQVFWWDDSEGVVCRYTRSGVFPISDYFMRDHFFQKAGKYKGSNVLGAIDPYYGQYILTFPSLDDSPAETIAFHIQSEKWEATHEYSDANGNTPDYYGNVGTRFYGFLQGSAYEHNVSDTYNNFYGDQKEREITLNVAPDVGKVKKLLTVSYAGDGLSSSDDTIVCEVLTEEQKTTIPHVFFDKKERKFYAPVLRDINTPEMDEIPALHDGDEMRDEVFDVVFKSDNSTVSLLHDVTLSYVYSDYSI